MKKISMSALKDGWLYEIEARNQNRGIWRESDRGFEIARQKAGSTFLFVEYDWDTGPPFGTARAFREIEKVPDEIMSDNAKRLEYLRSFVGPTNHELCLYVKDEKFKKEMDVFGYYDFVKGTRTTWNEAARSIE